jgi:hypothetical protein
LSKLNEIRTGYLPSNLLLTLNLLAYAIYFDHRRRNDPNFRKALRREHRRQAKAAKEEAEAQGALQREAIKAAMAEAKEEGFPTDAEEKETFFMSEVSRGEQLCQEGRTWFSRGLERTSSPEWTGSLSIRRACSTSQQNQLSGFSSLF